MRLTILDGFRGFFLLFMMIVHTNMLFDTIAGKLNHHSFGWVEDAQGFVFISGFVVGLVYGGRLIRRGYQACRTSVLQRIKTIYSHQAGLILIFLVAAFAVTAIWGPLAPGAYLSDYVKTPIETTVSSLFLVSGTLNMGILPMYIWFMFLTPMALWLLHTGRGLVLVMLMASVWIIGQTDVFGYAIEALETYLFESAGISVRISIFFNLLGWQTLYFSGLCFGYLQVAGKLDLSFFRQPQFFTIFKIGMVMFVFFGIVDRVVFNELFGPVFSDWFLTKTERRDFSSLYLVTFALDLFLVTWLLTAGRDCGNRVVERGAEFLNWFFTRRFLVFLGQHSLHVFSMRLLITYTLNTILQGQQFAPLWENLIVVLSPLPLYLGAWGHQKMVDRQKAQATLRAAQADT